MTSRAGSTIEAARRRASGESARAERAAQVAQRHEQLSRDGLPALAELHEGLVRMHRRMERVHRAAAGIHTSFADRLQAWHEAAEGRAARPSFIQAVADAAGSGSAAVTLLGADAAEALVATSDRTARVAQDLEFILGEGPSREATTGGRAVAAVGAELAQRWPQYGSAVAGLGVETVVAVPMRRRRTCLGVLAVFDPPGVAVDLASFQAVADALTHTVLLDTRHRGPDSSPDNAADSGPGDGIDDGLAGMPLFEETDDRRVVHRAAGMVAAQNGGDLAGALALIRARAFADDELAATIAHRVVAGELRLA